MQAIDQLIQQKQMFNTSHRQWLMRNAGMVQFYLDSEVEQGIHRAEHKSQWEYFKNYNPLLGRRLVENFWLNNQEKKDEVLSCIANTPGAMTLTLGQVGQGKTCLNLGILEELHLEYGKEVCMMQTDMRGIPNYIKQIVDPFDVPENTILFIDEASVTYNARNAITKDNKEMSMLMNIRRHQGLTILFASQHHGFVDINAMRAAHFFLFKSLCLANDTLIQTTEGNIPICELSIGDKVISYDNKKGKLEPQNVTGIYPEKRECVSITLENSETLRCSPEHRWFTKRGLVKTFNLTEDDELMMPL